MKKSIGWALWMVLALGCTAGDGSWLVRARVIGVSPNDDASQILDTGTTVTVDDDVVPEVDLTWMFKKHWGVEVIAATSQHKLATQDGALAGADAGKVWALPPTFTLQYHTGTDQTVDFYAGLGLNYTLFYSYDLSDDLAGLGVTDLDFDSSIGLAANLGLDFKINEKWVCNVDLKYIDMSTDVDLQTAAGVLDTLKVDIDPIVAGIGIGYRF